MLDILTNIDHKRYKQENSHDQRQTTTKNNKQDNCIGKQLRTRKKTTKQKHKQQVHKQRQHEIEQEMEK